MAVASVEGRVLAAGDLEHYDSNRSTSSGPELVINDTAQIASFRNG